MIHFKKSVPKINFGNGQSLQSPAFLEFINALEKFPLLAHHPACKHHNHHLIWVGKLPLCLGCTMMSLGIITGILIIPFLGFFKQLPFSVLLSLGVVLYLPAIVQIWVQKKPYKIMARFSLGVGIVFMFYAGLWLTPISLIGIILKLGFLAVFYIVCNLTLKIRAEHSVSPCQNCPDGRFPICAYTLPRIPKLAKTYFAHADGNDPEADEFVRALEFTTNNNYIE
jgi:uncharacterized membrane protein